MSKKRSKPDPYAVVMGHASSAARAASPGNRRMFLIGGAAGALVAAGSGMAWLTRPAAPSAAVNLDLDTLTLDRTSIDLGRVALNVVVPVVVRLTNQSQRVVTLGRPAAEALEGC